MIPKGLFRLFLMVTQTDLNFKYIFNIKELSYFLNHLNLKSMY